MLQGSGPGSCDLPVHGQHCSASFSYGWSCRHLGESAGIVDISLSRDKMCRGADSVITPAAPGEDQQVAAMGADDVQLPACTGGQLPSATNVSEVRCAPFASAEPDCSKGSFWLKTLRHFKPC